MKYRIIDMVSDYQEVQTGTCELCFGTAYVDEGHIVLEDEKGKKYEVNITEWDWGDYTSIEIDNIVDFNAWLINQDLTNEWFDKNLEGWSFNEDSDMDWWLLSKLAECYRKKGCAN